MKLSRRLTQLALRLMPRPVRFNIIRNGMKLNDDELRRVDAVRIASTIDEYVAAMTLVHDGYVNRGIMAPHEQQIRDIIKQKQQDLESRRKFDKSQLKAITSLNNSWAYNFIEITQKLNRLVGFIL